MYASTETINQLRHATQNDEVCKLLKKLVDYTQDAEKHPERLSEVVNQHPFFTREVLYPLLVRFSDRVGMFEEDNGWSEWNELKVDSLIQLLLLIRNLSRRESVRLTLLSDRFVMDRLCDVVEEFGDQLSTSTEGINALLCSINNLSIISASDPLVENLKFVTQAGFLTRVLSNMINNEDYYNHFVQIPDGDQAQTWAILIRYLFQLTQHEGQIIAVRNAFIKLLQDDRFRSDSVVVEAIFEAVKNFVELPRSAIAFASDDFMNAFKSVFNISSGQYLLSTRAQEIEELNKQLEPLLAKQNFCSAIGDIVVCLEGVKTVDELEDVCDRLICRFFLNCTLNEDDREAIVLQTCTLRFRQAWFHAATNVVDSTTTGASALTKLFELFRYCCRDDRFSRVFAANDEKYSNLNRSLEDLLEPTAATARSIIELASQRHTSHFKNHPPLLITYFSAIINFVSQPSVETMDAFFCEDGFYKLLADTLAAYCSQNSNDQNDFNLGQLDSFTRCRVIDRVTHLISTPLRFFNANENFVRKELREPLLSALGWMSNGIGSVTSDVCASMALLFDAEKEVYDPDDKTYKQLYAFAKEDGVRLMMGNAVHLCQTRIGIYSVARYFRLLSEYEEGESLLRNKRFRDALVNLMNKRGVDEDALGEIAATIINLSDEPEECQEIFATKIMRDSIIKVLSSKTRTKKNQGLFYKAILQIFSDGQMDSLELYCKNPKIVDAFLVPFKTNFLADVIQHEEWATALQLLNTLFKCEEGQRVFGARYPEFEALIPKCGALMFAAGKEEYEELCARLKSYNERFSQSGFASLAGSYSSLNVVGGRDTAALERIEQLEMELAKERGALQREKLAHAKTLKLLESVQQRVDTIFDKFV